MILEVNNYEYDWNEYFSNPQRDIKTKFIKPLEDR